MIEGRYFYPHATRFVAARASAASGMLRVEALDGSLLNEAPAKSLRLSPALGRLPARLSLGDGSHFESDDRAGIESLRRELKLRAPGGLLHRIERSWRGITLAVLATAALSYGFVAFGVPFIARKLAEATPPSIAVAMSRQTMQILDGRALAPSALKPKDRARLEALFRKVSAHEPRGAGGYTLLMRRGPGVGANAFALPDGSVVVTDALYALAKNDEEIEGVLAHEMSHVNHAHGLQRVYQASMIPAAIALLTGDVSQVSQMATVLPGILVQSAYSRNFEQQADDDAAAILRAMGAKPSRLGDLLLRLEEVHCHKGGCAPSWLGSHPETA
ncbi:MAG: M48 family metallopeptidase, partial [Alphaproteobacteria bacterium]|nr:M48 family metallopeptidase [Alphaproteobacteria bacterium]